MEIFLYPLYTCFNALFFLRELQIFHQKRTWLSFLLTIELFGLLYDTLVICLGNSLGVGPLLAGLSVPRFWMHALMTPLTVVIVLELLRVSGVRGPRQALWGLTLGLIGYGIATDAIDLDIVPVSVGGVLYYTHAIPPGPPLAAIVTIFVSLVLGGILWRQRSWPWLCIGALTVLVGYGVLARSLGMVVGYGAEQLFIMSLLATQYRFCEVKFTQSGEKASYPSSIV